MAAHEHDLKEVQALAITFVSGLIYFRRSDHYPLPHILSFILTNLLQDSARVSSSRSSEFRD